MRRSHDTTFWALNEELLDCEDTARLGAMLKKEVGAKCLYRALRVHGRLNAVRRAQEIRAIEAACLRRPLKREAA